MQLTDVLEEFIFDCKLRRMSERTIKGYKNNNLRFITFIRNEYQVSELEKVHCKLIKAYLEQLSSLGRMPSYINGIIKSMRAFYRYCIDEEYLFNNPMDKVKFQKEPMTLITTFNNNEVKKMVVYYSPSNFEYRNKLIMITLFDTGIRNSELCNLLLTSIREEYIMIMGKGKKERVVSSLSDIKQNID